MRDSGWITPQHHGASQMTIDERMEEAMGDFFFAPPDVTVVDRPAIKYAHAPRESPLYNRVVRVRPSLEEPRELVEEVAHAHQGCPSQWNVNALGDDPRLRAALEDAGYVRGSEYDAYVHRVGEYRRKSPTDVNVRRVESRRDLILLHDVRDDVFDGSEPLSDEDLDRELKLATGKGASVLRFVAFRNGEPSGTGSMTFFGEHDIALIWAGGVREEHRENGVYTALLAARFEAAAQRQIGLVGLFAQTTTSGPIVAAHGFERHGAMVAWHRGL